MDILHTERLTLRRFTTADLDAIVELNSDPEVMRYLTGGSSLSREWVEGTSMPRLLAIPEHAPDFGYWALIERDSGDFVGWVGLTLDEEESGEVELGYRLRRSSWGKGYATEGSRAMLRVAFAYPDIRRVVANTYEENLPSRRVMERIGMTLVRSYRMTAEELAATDSPPGYLWEGDDVEYALSREDWQRLEVLTS